MSARQRVGPATLAEDASAAAADALRLRLAGLLFERPRAAWADEVRSLAGAQPDRTLAVASEAGAAATEGDYLRVFGPGGSVSPREVAYQGFADPGRILADLSAFYDAFAFHPRAEDPFDHIAVETGFVGYLAMKEAYALATGDRQRAAMTRKARTLFLKTHLRPFVAGLRLRLSGADAPAHLQRTVRFMAGWARCDLLGSEILAPKGSAEEPALTCGEYGCRETCAEGETKPEWTADPFGRT